MVHFVQVVHCNFCMSSTYVHMHINYYSDRCTFNLPNKSMHVATVLSYVRSTYVALEFP